MSPASTRPVAESPADHSTTAARWVSAARVCAWASLLSQMLIVVTGAFVRVTASGLGCPTWPQCMPGSFTPVTVPATAYHAWVEFGNRLLTFAVGATALASLVSYLVARRFFAGALDGFNHTSPRLARAGWLAASGLIGTAAQAVVGGISVRTHLSPAWVSAHFLISAAILIAQTRYVALYSAGNAQRASSPVTAALIWATGLTLVLGTVTTGSGPHAGDFNVTSRFPFAPAFITSVHAAAALVTVAATVFVRARAKQNARVRLLATLLLILELAQGCLGYVQFRLGLPPVLVVIHVALAIAIWVGALRTHWESRRSNAL